MNVAALRAKIAGHKPSVNEIAASLAASGVDLGDERDVIAALTRWHFRLADIEPALDDAIGQARVLRHKIGEIQ